MRDRIARQATGDNTCSSCSALEGRLEAKTGSSMPHYNDSSRRGDRSSSHPGAGNRKKKTHALKSSGRGTPAGKLEQSPGAQQDIDTATKPEASRVPIQLNQKLLDLFAAAFPGLLDTSASSPTSKLSTLLAQVKRHLYNRDFSAAFGSDEYLAAYAARWSPSRALGYLIIFDEVVQHLDPSLAIQTNVGEETRDSTHVTCLGGGAGAELIALAGMLSLRTAPDATASGKAADDTPTPPNLNVTSMDSAAWSPVHDDLYRAIIRPPTLSKYASAVARAANRALVPSETFSASCTQLDVLSSEAAPRSQLQSAIQSSALITLMFTLNELYSASLSRTQALLQDLTAWTAARSGTLLLVVDSPGSYSEVGIGPQKKTYPMQWMLDLALLGLADKQDEESAPWVKLVSEDSRWFRLPPPGQLKYPIDLENMRFQMHLYRRR